MVKTMKGLKRRWLKGMGKYGVHREGVGGGEVTVGKANLDVLPCCPAAILRNLELLFTY